MASMVATDSPVRTRSAEARAPSSRPTASTRIDLPAPVSPVKTLNPGSNSTSTASITARLRMRRKRSMRAELQSYHTFDSTQGACYARSSALSQRRVDDASEASLHTLGFFVLALQVQDGAAPIASGSRDLIASIAPFIGLFGTVVGITIAFQRIGTTGSTNLAVVGPSISEALIATAAGLFAAIPAVLAYNAFSTRVKLFAAEMDDFSLEFLNIAERNFT